MALVRRHAHRCIDMYGQPDPPGFRQLDWQARMRLNAKALLLFLHSGEGLRMSLYLLLWILAGLLLAWYLDLRQPRLQLPMLSACIWMWPWLMRARRRRLTQLLRRLWPAD